MKFSNLTIAAKLTTAFGAIILVLAMSSAVIFFGLSQIDKANDRALEESELGLAVLELTQELAHNREMFLNYITTGKPMFEKMYRQTTTAFEAALEAVMAPLEAGHEEQEILLTIRGLIDNWRTEIAQQQLELMQTPEGADQARAIEKSGKPAAIFREIEELFSTFTEQRRAENAQIKEAGHEAAANAVWGTTAALVATFSLALVFGLLMHRSIARPMARMGAAMAAISKGDMEVEIPGLGRRDEIGRMATTLEAFKRALQERRELEIREQEHNAARETRRQRLEHLTAEFEAAITAEIDAVETALDRTLETAGAVSDNALATSNQSTTVTTATGQASANIQAVTAATGELTASIEEIARQISRTATFSRQAVDQSDGASGKVTALDNAAERIGQVVSLINDIAEQTNLLALNATIEAARAGDAGKGFAVVAGEVKHLASQTAKATDEITQHINDIQSETRSAVEAIGSISGTIREMDQLTAAVSGAVEEQGAATQEILRAIEQASAGTEEVSAAMGGVAQAAEETETLTRQQSEVLGDLRRRADRLRQRIEEYLTGAQAA